MMRANPNNAAPSPGGLATGEFLSWQPGLFSAALSSTAIALHFLGEELWAAWLCVVNGGLLGWVLACGPGQIWQRLSAVAVLAVAPVLLVSIPSWGGQVWSGLGWRGLYLPLVRGQSILLVALVTGLSLPWFDALWRLLIFWLRLPLGAAVEATGRESSDPQEASASDDPRLDQIPADPLGSSTPIGVGPPEADPRNPRQRAWRHRPGHLSAGQCRVAFGSWRRLTTVDWLTLVGICSVALALSQHLVEELWRAARQQSFGATTSRWDCWELILRQAGIIGIAALGNALLVISPLLRLRFGLSASRAQGPRLLAGAAGLWTVLSSPLLLILPTAVAIELAGLVGSSALITSLFFWTSAGQLPELMESAAAAHS